MICYCFWLFNNLKWFVKYTNDCHTVDYNFELYKIDEFKNNININMKSNDNSSNTVILFFGFNFTFENFYLDRYYRYFPSKF